MWSCCNRSFCSSVTGRQGLLQATDCFTTSARPWPCTKVKEACPPNKRKLSRGTANRSQAASSGCSFMHTPPPPSTAAVAESGYYLVYSYSLRLAPSFVTRQPWQGCASRIAVIERLVETVSFPPQLGSTSGWLSMNARRDCPDGVKATPKQLGTNYECRSS